MGLILAFVPFAFQWKIIRLSLVPVLASIVGLVVLGFATSQISFGEVGSNHDYIQVLGVEVPLTGRQPSGKRAGWNQQGRTLAVRIWAGRLLWEQLQILCFQYRARFVPEDSTMATLTCC